MTPEGVVLMEEESPGSFHRAWSSFLEDTMPMGQKARDTAAVNKKDEVLGFIHRACALHLLERRWDTYQIVELAIKQAFEFAIR